MRRAWEDNLVRGSSCPATRSWMGWMQMRWKHKSCQRLKQRSFFSLRLPPATCGLTRNIAPETWNCAPFWRIFHTSGWTSLCVPLPIQLEMDGSSISLTCGVFLADFFQGDGDCTLGQTSIRNKILGKCRFAAWSIKPAFLQGSTTKVFMHSWEWDLFGDHLWNCWSWSCLLLLACAQWFCSMRGNCERYKSFATKSCPWTKPLTRWLLRLKPNTRCTTARWKSLSLGSSHMHSHADSKAELGSVYLGWTWLEDNIGLKCATVRFIDFVAGPELFWECAAISPFVAEHREGGICSTFAAADTLAGFLFRVFEFAAWQRSAKKACNAGCHRLSLVEVMCHVLSLRCLICFRRAIYSCFFFAAGFVFFGSWFYAFLLLCFSASLLLCLSTSLLFCFSAVLLLCFSAFCFSCFSACLLLCFSASLLFCFFASPLFAFPASLLVYFSAFLLLCFSASLLLCFLLFLLFLLLCLSTSLFSAFVLLCLSTSTILLFSFLQSCVLLLYFLLLCFSASRLYYLFVFFLFFCFILSCLYPKRNPKDPRWNQKKP